MHCRRCRVEGRRTGVSLFVVLVVIVAAIPSGGAAAALARRDQLQPAGEVRAGLVFRPPVRAPIRDPFRLPDGPYGAGNRGIEYDTSRGDEVVAGAAGRVTFAGAVASTLHVTIDHNGVRSSYSFLERVLVARGDEVRRGQLVGIAGERFHFGARVGDRYIDPALLIGSAQVTVRLVPHRSPVRSADSAPVTTPGGGASDRRQRFSIRLGRLVQAVIAAS